MFDFVCSLFSLDYICSFSLFFNCIPAISSPSLNGALIVCPSLPSRLSYLHAESISRTTSKSCSQMVCLFGSKCKETSTSGGGRKAQCVCDGLCDQRTNDFVASNGNHSAPFMPSSSALVSSSSSPTVGLFSFTPVGNNNKEGNNKTRNNNSSKSLTGTEVCGSDGKTYKSEAELRCHSCRIQESIIIIHPGPCRSKENLS